MTGIDKALLRQLLSINGAWEIDDYQLDPRKQRCDVWVGPQVERGWFGRPKSAPPRTQAHSWQHVPLGGLRFFLHVNVPVGAPLGRLPWSGDPGMPFTHTLAQQVFVMFNEGLPLPAVCKLLGLSLNDVWRYRFAIDNGLVQGEQPAPAAKSAADAAPDAAPAGSGVPDVTDPVWLRVVDGDLKLDIRVLSLKLMLTRVRSQLEVISDDEVRLLKLRDLHRYFVKNERVLGHELAQLRAAA